MLSLASAASLAFAPTALPSRLPQASAGPVICQNRVGPIVLQNEMEPDEGWNVDNLTNMMDEASGAAPAAEEKKGSAGISNFISRKDDDGDNAALDIGNNALRVVFGAVVVLLFAGPQLGIGPGQ